MAEFMCVPVNVNGAGDGVRQNQEQRVDEGDANRRFCYNPDASEFMPSYFLTPAQNMENTPPPPTETHVPPTNFYEEVNPLEVDGSAPMYFQHFEDIHVEQQNHNYGFGDSQPFAGLPILRPLYPFDSSKLLQAFPQQQLPSYEWQHQRQTQVVRFPSPAAPSPQNLIPNPVMLGPPIQKQSYASSPSTFTPLYALIGLVPYPPPQSSTISNVNPGEVIYNNQHQQVAAAPQLPTFVHGAPGQYPRSGFRRQQGWQNSGGEASFIPAQNVVPVPVYPRHPPPQAFHQSSVHNPRTPPYVSVNIPNVVSSNGHLNGVPSLIPFIMPSDSADPMLVPVPQFDYQ